MNLIVVFIGKSWSNISDNFKALIGIRYDIFKGRYATDKIKADRTLIKAGDRTEIPSTAFSYRVWFGVSAA
ncbi:hypothetical protein PJW08_06210 [Tenacibaculum finnmarkense]|nr:hypothetical protein PJW08_06210 [Tenacibaculum finnmarkense]